LEGFRERDGELVRRARAGDRAAFEELVRGELRGVYALLFRLAGNHEDAEDLAQECFVRAWTALPTLRADQSLTAWLRRIALHLARDHHRARSRRGRLEEFDEEHSSGGADRRERAPGDELSSRETVVRLRDALERLPERLRAPLFLRVMEGLDYGAVADATGVRPATARTQVMEARQMLLRWLRPWFEGRSR